MSRYANDFDRAFATFDPYADRNPANDPYPYPETEIRYCECCDEVLALTDKGTTCAACTEVCEADAAFHATLK